MALRIITDSACDLPKEQAERYNIEIIPTPLLIDGQDYLDGETVQAKEFYDLLREGKRISTYHINTYMFTEHFEPYARRGDSLIYICFSTGIAGTYNAASLAGKEIVEQYPEFDLTIIDSKCASIGFGTIVLYAGMLLERCQEKEKIIDSVIFCCKHMKHIFTVDTLEYLLKGGRISKTAALAGELLNIRPMIAVNEEGALHAVGKVRGRRKSIQRLVDYVGEKGISLDRQVIGIVHGDDEEMLEYVNQMLMERYHVKNTLQNYVGCAIGAHTGPGIIGITFMDEIPEFLEEILQ